MSAVGSLDQREREHSMGIGPAHRSDEQDGQTRTTKGAPGQAHPLANADAQAHPLASADAQACRESQGHATVPLGGAREMERGQEQLADCPVKTGAASASALRASGLPAVRGIAFQTESSVRAERSKEQSHEGVNSDRII